MEWFGHSPEGYRRHIVDTAQRSPVGRTLPALCGARVKVTRKVVWEDYVPPSMTCLDCLRLADREVLLSE